MGRPEETEGEAVTSEATAAKAATSESLWNVRQCAEYLQMSVSWVYRQCDAGNIPHAKLGHALRFHPARVREYAAKMMGASAKVIPLRGNR